MPSRQLPPLAAIYVRWTFLRAILHRGWWLVTSLYLVVEANLSPLELVLLGTAQGLTVIVFEIPTGVVADTFSRKWSIVLAHALMGTAMLTTGLVTSFPALVLTQMLWGLSWTFSSGADVAWLTDEVDQPDDINRLLSVAARWGLVGAAAGLTAFGLLAWLTTLSVAMVLAGSLMLVLGLYVASAFSEGNFVPKHQNRASELARTFRQGLTLARNNRSVLLVLSVTFVVNGADEAFSRLFAKELIELGLPDAPDPVVWLTVLGLVTLAAGAAFLRLIEDRLRGELSLLRWYALGGFLGSAGILLFGIAPNHLIAMAGVVVVHGIAWNVVRVVGVIWINERSTSEARATLQSFLSQAENLGEVTLGLGLGAIAQFFDIQFSMICAALLCAAAAAAVVHHRKRLH